MYGDPSRLYALANAIDGKADTLDGHVRTLQSASVDSWVSSAADSHRARLADDLRRVTGCGDDLRAAADVLRGHARTLQHRLDEIHAAEREVRAWFDKAEGLFSSAVHDAENVASSAWGAMTSLASGHIPHITAPWSGWPWSPTSLPLPGHLDWLDALQLVRSAG